jgi:2-methylcitrate dehydratase PrpD
MTAIERLAQFVTTAEPDPSLKDIIAPAVSDCFGCILLGARSDLAQGVKAALKDFGAGSCPVYGTGETLSAPYAALTNAVSGHVWELDDWEEPGNTHPGVVLLPALLASSAVHRSSGAEALAAYAVGAETIMRLGEAVTLDHYARGFHSTATLGTIGAAAAVSRLIGASAEQTAHALALAVSQATGYTLQFGSNAKPLQIGWAARNGLEAAFLAANGMTGQPHILDHPRGFAGLMGELDQDRFETAMNALGRPWALNTYGLVLKPWPSCGYTHRLMTAALQVRPTVSSRLSEVVSIKATLPDFHAEILPFHRPTTRTEALFSIPACVAQILDSGDLTLDDSARGFWTGKTVSRLVSLTSVQVEKAKDPSLNYDPDQPDRLLIEFRDGDVVETSCTYPLGATQNPMPTEKLGAKFQAVTGLHQEHFTTLLGWPKVSDFAAFFKGYANGTT